MVFKTEICGFLFFFSCLVLLSLSLTSDVLPVPSFDMPASELTRYLSLGETNLSFPALYVFGDSFLDSGNNNFLSTLARSNYTPYGVDFVGGIATGRCTNGRTSADFIAQVAGLPFPPPYEGSAANKTLVLTGINYASASAGVLAEPPKVKEALGDILTFDEQIDSFQGNIKALRTHFNSQESFDQYLAKSIFFVHASSNDLGINWALYYSKLYNNTQDYVTYLAEEFPKRLKRLYELGARKFVVNNVSPLGCMPYQRNTFKPKTECVDQANLPVFMYNQLLKAVIPKLELSLSGSKFILGDLNKIFFDVLASPITYGIKNVHDSCCVDRFHNGTSQCEEHSVPCPDRSAHMFFDPFHPSESIHFLWARRLLKDPTISFPCTLVGLIHA